MAILLFDDSRRAPRSAVGDAVYGDDVVLSPLPRHYQKSQKKAAAATTTSITASAILWTYTCISFACNLTRVATRGNRALARVAARQGFNGNARQRAVCERGLIGLRVVTARSIYGPGKPTRCRKYLSFSWAWLQCLIIFE